MAKWTLSRLTRRPPPAVIPFRKTTLLRSALAHSLASHIDLWPSRWRPSACPGREELPERGSERYHGNSADRSGDARSDDQITSVRMPGREPCNRCRFNDHRVPAMVCGRPTGPTDLEV